jgi:hypothetical protein
MSLSRILGETKINAQGIDTSAEVRLETGVPAASASRNARCAQETPVIVERIRVSILRNP